MKHLLKHVTETWPDVPVWVRKLHRVGPVGGASCESRDRCRTAPPELSWLADMRFRCTRRNSLLTDIIILLPSSYVRTHTPADDWRHTGREDHGSQATFSNFFTDIRIHTIREMQDQVVRDLGVPSYDFGDSWEGWQAHQDMVHPKKVRASPPVPRFPVFCSLCSPGPLTVVHTGGRGNQFPGGPVYTQALLHHIWMESQGRDRWQEAKRRRLAAVGKLLEDVRD